MLIVCLQHTIKRVFKISIVCKVISVKETICSNVESTIRHPWGLCKINFSWFLWYAFLWTRRVFNLVSLKVVIWVILRTDISIKIVLVVISFLLFSKAFWSWKYQSFWFKSTNSNAFHGILKISIFRNFTTIRKHFTECPIISSIPRIRVNSSWSAEISTIVWFETKWYRIQIVIPIIRFSLLENFIRIIIKLFLKRKKHITISIFVINKISCICKLRAIHNVWNFSSYPLSINQIILNLDLVAIIIWETIQIVVPPKGFMSIRPMVGFKWFSILSYCLVPCIFVASIKSWKSILLALTFSKSFICDSYYSYSVFFKGIKTWIK